MEENEAKRLLDGLRNQVDTSVNEFVGVHVVYEKMRAAGFSMIEATRIIGVWIGHSLEGQ